MSSICAVLDTKECEDILTQIIKATELGDGKGSEDKGGARKKNQEKKRDREKVQKGV